MTRVNVPWIVAVGRQLVGIVARLSATRPVLCFIGHVCRPMVVTTTVVCRRHRLCNTLRSTFSIIAWRWKTARNKFTVDPRIISNYPVQVSKTSQNSPKITIYFEALYHNFLFKKKVWTAWESVLTRHSSRMKIIFRFYALRLKVGYILDVIIWTSLAI